MKTCCFIGHRKIREPDVLRERVGAIMEDLITKAQVDTFLFGSKSQFDDLCRELAAKIKTKYPHLKRIYVRAEYPYISENYREYLLKTFEDTFFPEKLLNAGNAVYLERNYEMIRQSDYCVIYYDEQCAPATRKSGAKAALEFARRQKKTVIDPTV